MQSSPEVWKDFFETYYRDELNKAAEKTISLNGSTPINVNFLKDLVIFKEGIVAEELMDYPDIVLDHANHGIANSENIHNVKLENSRARVYNLPISRRVLIRDLRSEHISKLVSIDGVVRKVTEVRPRVVEAAFVCSSCAVKMFIHQEDSTIKYPYECKSCGSRKFIFLPEESKSIDSQRMRIQEYPENLRGGEQPQTLDVVLENDLTGIINPGDRVVINGIVRATPRSLSGKRLRHMDITLEGNSIEVLQQEYEEFEITEEDKKMILEIGNDPEIFEKIVKSIAPVIYGYEDMKMSVALQLFGGIPKKLPDGTEIRGDVHVLLVGDPGVAKSQLLRYVHRIAPRSVYTTGKGTTSAGLTAAATKDEYDGRWTLEAGALVLADKGIALVDEIDKMKADDRGGLHEAMEQQSYHPSFEITLSDGSKHKIGQLVDELFDEYPERRVDGIDCEILDTWGLNIELLTTDFKETFRKKADRVSRHKAPDYFVKIKYSNGREIIVTPEHPVFVFRNGETVTEEASQIKSGDFVPSVKNMEFSGEKQRWLKIKEVEYIPNEGEYKTDWVYDVTVEPTHNFISHGIILHNTVSVAKAGINAVLWARCAMLGAANPKYGRFDRYAPIAEQIDLSPTLLSRFDLIFVMTDDPDESRDRALAQHILDSHELGEKLEKLKNIVSTEYDQNAVMAEAKKIEPAIEPELLRKYIAYAKRTVFPVLTREVKQTIEDFYSSLRSQAKENTPMPVTARQLEALIRLAEASARLQLKDKVTIEDVNRVISIVKKSLEQIAVDPETGEMDIDYAFSGTSKTQRDRIMVIKKIVEEIAAVHEKGAPEDEVLNSAEEQGISWNKAKEILQKMRMNGEVYCPKPGYFDITHNY